MAAEGWLVLGISSGSQRGIGELWMVGQLVSRGRILMRPSVGV
jgi:hypothetical protein